MSNFVLLIFNYNNISFLCYHFVLYFILLYLLFDDVKRGRNSRYCIFLVHNTFRGESLELQKQVGDSSCYSTFQKITFWSNSWWTSKISKDVLSSSKRGRMWRRVLLIFVYSFDEDKHINKKKSKLEDKSNQVSIHLRSQSLKTRAIKFLFI